MKHWASPLVPALILAAMMFANVEAQQPRQYSAGGYGAFPSPVQPTARWQPVPDSSLALPPGEDYDVSSGVPDYYVDEEPLWEDSVVGEQPLASSGAPRRIVSSDPARDVLKPEIAERFDYGSDYDPDGLWLDDPTWYGGNAWADGGCCDDAFGSCLSYRFPGAEWFFEGELTMLQRNRPEYVGLTAGYLFNTSSTAVTQIPQELLSTDAADFELKAGMRLMLGRNLGTDEEGRMHSVEGGYFGLQEWSEQATVYGSRVAFVRNEGGQQVIYQTGSLMSYFNAAIGGFNYADVHNFQYSSNLHNAELNYRIRRNPGRELLQAEPDGAWIRRLARVTDASVHFGLRYIHIDEDFTFGASGNQVRNGVAFPSSGLWQSSTSNDMFGGQVGGEIMIKRERLWAGVRGNFGLLVNFADLDGRVSVTDYVFPADRSLPGMVNPNNVFSMSDTNLGIVGDVRLSLVYDISRQAKLKASYNFMWVEGIALAPEQFQNHSIRGPDEVNTDGYTFFHGPSAGFEWAW